MGFRANHVVIMGKLANSCLIIKPKLYSDKMIYEPLWELKSKIKKQVWTWDTYSIKQLEIYPTLPIIKRTMRIGSINLYIATCRANCLIFLSILRSLQTLVSFLNHLYCYFFILAIYHRSLWLFSPTATMWIALRNGKRFFWRDLIIYRILDGVWIIQSN
jgi:hypothetical protein